MQRPVRRGGELLHSARRRVPRRCRVRRRRRRPWTRPPGRAPSLVVAAVERRRPVALALGFALEVDAIGGVDDSIEYRVRDCWFSDHLWPALHGDLTGDQDGLASVARLGCQSAICVLGEKGKIVTEAQVASAPVSLVSFTRVESVGISPTVRDRAGRGRFILPFGRQRPHIADDRRAALHRQCAIGDVSGDAGGRTHDQEFADGQRALQGAGDIDRVRFDRSLEPAGPRDLKLADAGQLGRYEALRDQSLAG